MAAHLHCQVVLPNVNGLPADVYVNTFAVRQPGAQVVPGAVGEVSQAIAAFYNNPTGLNNVLASYMSSAISRAAGACKIKVYDVGAHLDGSPHGSPILTDSFQLAAAGSGNDYPDEVALVGTIEGSGRAAAQVEVADNFGADPDDADLLRDRPKQRRTGRIYFGPLKFNAAGAGTGRSPSADVVSDLAEALVRLDTTLRALTTPSELCVWSRKNQAFYAIESAYADNAYDTQRPRGNKATTRTRFMRTV